MTLIQSGEPKGSLLVQIRKIKGETNMPSQSIFDMKGSKVYTLLLLKVVRHCCRVHRRPVDAEDSLVGQAGGRTGQRQTAR